MKIFTNDAVYVQKNDICFLSNTDLPILASIFMKVFGNGITIIDDNNRYEFVKFEEKDEIEYFKNLDFIVDYDTVKDLDDEQIINLGQEIIQERNNIAQKYNVLSDDEKQANIQMYYQCEMLEFKMYSVRDILWFKQGHIKMSLPKEVDSSREVKGIKKLLRKFKNKKKY